MERIVAKSVDIFIRRTTHYGVAINVYLLQTTLLSKLVVISRQLKLMFTEYTYNTEEMCIQKSEANASKFLCNLKELFTLLVVVRES